MPSRGAKLYQLVFHRGVPRGARVKEEGLLRSPSSVKASLPCSSVGGGSTSQRTPPDKLTFGRICHSSCTKAAVSLNMGVAGSVFVRMAILALSLSTADWFKNIPET